MMYLSQDQQKNDIGNLGLNNVMYLIYLNVKRIDNGIYQWCLMGNIGLT